MDFLRTTLFGDVDAEALRELADHLSTVTLRDGDVLVRRGDSNRNLYLVRSGCLRVLGELPSHEPRVFFHVQPGETVCEMGVLSDDLSSTTVDALGETSVLVLTRADFDRFSAAHPDAALHVIQSLSRRLLTYRLSIALHLGHLFAPFSPAVARDLEAELEMFTLYGGEVLFRAGEPGDYLCLIINGRMRVTVPDGQTRDRFIAELGPGEIVGEMAVVTGEARNATVVAVRDSQLARLTAAAFERLLIKHPSWAVRMVSHTLAQRLKDANSGKTRGRQNVATVAIVPTDRSAPVRAFCEQLVVALSAFGPALHLTSARVDECLGRPGIAQTYAREGLNVQMAEWLTKQESEHRHVLYEADSGLSPWTERCIRQADYIILVGDGTGDPRLGEIETELLGPSANRNSARQWLVLVHGQREPSGTKCWLDVRGVERHYHVRLGDRASFDRLARHLTGRAVGLTLGGGFARGLAHIGVFRAFEESNVPIDAIGSASMGAMLGGLWALGRDRDRMVREICDSCGEMLGDMTFPFVAFKRGGKFSQKVRNLFGDVQIEDLWIPFFCISANLNRSELKVHSEGSLAKAVLASTRAPGVFPPIVYDGELHVDGGVINNVPVDIMKEFCNQGLTIGVDVAPPHPIRPVRDYGDRISGWMPFWQRCFAKKKSYTPSILLVLIRTLEYTGISNQNVRLKSADIFMSPEMLKFRRTDFHLAAEIVQAGYDCARASLLEHRTKFANVTSDRLIGGESPVLVEERAG